MRRHLMVFVVAGALAARVLAHDEGHGPRLTDQPLQGGTLNPVVKASEAGKGPKAALIYKAELVRGEDSTVRLYLYDTQMKPLPLEGLGKTATATIGPMKKTAKWKAEKFQLAHENGAFVGKMPKARVKPYFIDVVVEEKGQKLLTAHDNLD